MVCVAALRIAEAERSEIEVGGSHVGRVVRIHKRLRLLRVKSCRRSHDVRVDTKRISRSRWTFGARIEPIRQPRENVDRQPRTPGDNRKDAPALSQPLRTGIPRPVEGQVPSTAERDAVADVLVTRSAETARRISRNRRVSLPEARDVVNRVSQGIGQSEIGSPEKAVIRNLFSQTRLQAVIAGLSEILEFRYSSKAASRVRICARRRVSIFIHASGIA